jgi:CheY-like chemotaxis protein
LGLLETFRPAFILMDIQLPTIDGTELTQLIRSEPGNSDIFIVALTAHGTEEWRQRALKAGCDSYLAKPISIAKLKDALSERRSNRGDAAITAPAYASVDKNALMTRLGGDRDLLKELQQTFVEECPRVSSELYQHLHARDSVALADAAHALKGMLSTFSAIGAQHAAEALELAAMAGDLTAATTELDNVGREVEMFLKGLAELVESV